MLFMIPLFVTALQLVDAVNLINCIENSVRHNSNCVVPSVIQIPLRRIYSNPYTFQTQRVKMEIAPVPVWRPLLLPNAAQMSSVPFSTDVIHGIAKPFYFYAYNPNVPVSTNSINAKQMTESYTETPVPDISELLQLFSDAIMNPGQKSPSDESQSQPKNEVIAPDKSSRANVDEKKIIDHDVQQQQKLDANKKQNYDQMKSNSGANVTSTESPSTTTVHSVNTTNTQVG